jgi:hypothetical protein
MSVRSRLKPAMLAAMVAAAGSLSALAPVQAQEVTVLRGSPPRPLPPSVVYDNSQDNQSGNYSPSSYDDAYPYYGDGFPVGIGDGRGFHGGFHRGGLFHRGFRGGFHRGGLFHRGFRGGFHRGGFHAGFHGGGFRGGGFHGGGFSGGGFHGGGGHR